MRVKEGKVAATLGLVGAEGEREGRNQVESHKQGAETTSLHALLKA